MLPIQVPTIMYVHGICTYGTILFVFVIYKRMDLKLYTKWNTETNFK